MHFAPPQQMAGYYSNLSGRRKALCIGINYAGTSSELRGVRREVPIEGVWMSLTLTPGRPLVPQRCRERRNLPLRALQLPPRRHCDASGQAGSQHDEHPDARQHDPRDAVARQGCAAERLALLPLFGPRRADQGDRGRRGGRRGRDDLSARLQDCRHDCRQRLAPPSRQAFAPRLPFDRHL